MGTLAKIRPKDPTPFWTETTIYNISLLAITVTHQKEDSLKRMAATCNSTTKNPHPTFY